MHVFLELWSPKPSWSSVSPAARQALMQRLGEATGPILQEGSVEVLGWGKADPTVDHPAPHQYFAVWRAPDSAVLAQLREVIAREGWYDYFDQVNVTGELHPPEVVIAEHITM